MAKTSIPKGVIKDILIVVLGVVVIWFGLWAVFGTQNPFYVVSSGSMVPELLVYDVLVVNAHVDFEEIQVGDIIVFDRPSGHDRVIVHRVVSIIDDNPKTLRTKGDANPASLPGTDFPITEEEYLGKVHTVIPQIGYVTQILRPPVNYVLIAIVLGVMIVKQMVKKKKEKELGFEDPFGEEGLQEESSVDIPDLEKLRKDEVYSKPNEKFEKEENNTSRNSSNEEEDEKKSETKTRFKGKRK